MHFEQYVKHSDFLSKALISVKPPAKRRSQTFPEAAKCKALRPFVSLATEKKQGHDVHDGPLKITLVS